MSRPATIVTIAIATIATGCEQRRLAASGDVQADYAEERTSVVGTDSGGTSIRGSTDPLTGGACIVVGDDCVAPEAAGTFCERDGGPYDIIVVDGEVVGVICYPPAADGETTVVEGDGDVVVPQNENNTTVTFEEATNGIPIEGDLVIDGNNVAVYGNGVDETVIKGNVVLDGNNVRLRGLTIDGNLSVPRNSLAMVFVKVTGDVLISGNNNVFTGSDVFGDLTITGNNTVLVQNRVQGAFEISGTTGICTDNAAFTDANDDGVIDATEIGDELVCGG